MPEPYNIYARQLQQLRLGQPLYNPAPQEDEGRVELGDVGYVRGGAFCRLFNVSWAADDPRQIYGVPPGFNRISLGRIRHQTAVIGPGPLVSGTISWLSPHAEIQGRVLPSDLSFQFSCTSSSGAILVLETEMSQEEVLQDRTLEDCALENCASWYLFAKNKGIRLYSGEIVLVTQCLRTAAWASNVYYENSSRFEVSFLTGGLLSPVSSVVDIDAGDNQVMYIPPKRSQRRVDDPAHVDEILKDQTMFFKGYRPSTRELHIRSIASEFYASICGKKANLDPMSPVGNQDTPPSIPPASSEAGGRLPDSSISQTNLSYDVPSMALEDDPLYQVPDFNPAAILLAHKLDTTQGDVAVVHDDEWCSSPAETSELVEEYTKFFFDEAIRRRIIESEFYSDVFESLEISRTSCIDSST